MQIIKTADGSHTIYHSDLDEHYHSVKGAITGSKHVYIENGYDFIKSVNPKIFEVGFGTGLNCLLTALRAEEKQRQTTYLTIEKFPVESDFTGILNFGRLISDHAQCIFEKIHECKWDEYEPISNYFNLLKIKGDLLDFDLAGIKNCNLIYFDAFGPGKQPDMWTSKVFEKIYILTANEGVLVTYSAKGDVRRLMAATGFEMQRLQGPPGKFHMLRGIKKDAKI